MRKFITVILLLFATYSVWAQKKSIIIPGNGHIDVEKLNKPIDLNMDLSKLTLSELRVLRNSFAARQGYVFMEADLRSLFSQTSWYDSLMWKRFEPKDREVWGFFDREGIYNEAPIHCTKEELQFINRIQEREDELVRNDGNIREDGSVNMRNLINPYQVERFDPKLKAALGEKGFAIVPSNGLQLFHVYEKNDYSNFPSFVTTDLYLQLFHLYFDSVLREIEENKFHDMLMQLSRDMYRYFSIMANDRSTPSVLVDNAAWCQAYFGVSVGLLSGKLPDGLKGTYKKECTDEMGKIMKSENNFSDLLEFHDVYFNYSLFRPRGHYTRSELLKRYFRAMMWLQTAPFGTDKPEQLQRAVMIAHVIGANPSMLKAYNNIFEPITFLMGKPDNVTILQVYDAYKKQEKPLDEFFKNQELMTDLRSEIEEIARSQTRIKPKFERTSACKINLMPQRYQPDAEVLQEMVDYESPVTKRDTPKGLDVMAAMGSIEAERILLEELKEGENWSGYKPMLQKMKTQMNEIDWSETVATKWLDALKTMNDTVSDHRLPYFMLTSQWKKKELNTALASWAELKHDAILYAKQPMGAECGGGGLPEPIVHGYVEPNIKFWKKAVALVNNMEEILTKYGLLTDKAMATTEQIIDHTEFLLRISKKELSSDMLSEQEYKQIEIIGSTFENISLDLVRDKNQILVGWDDIQGTDKSIAVVADVYTANAVNNPPEKHSILYEAVGPVDEIYVVVEVNNRLYLTRGAVFSYREFKQSTDEQRLTDEEWQQKLKTNPRKGVPTWMKEVIVPLEIPVEDNDRVFYGSGC
ncbi:DUF3160 domain-containing protein [Hoylesella oralis]|uniref:DUF3160 domain-containing protein n=1 Tax=Hoylesella oralis TaxID=28134 RepID=UPI0028E78B58|nr:DUF3160 domain-containing protein [Hoylesella oralis]